MLYFLGFEFLCYADGKGGWWKGGDKSSNLYIAADCKDILTFKIMYLYVKLASHQELHHSMKIFEAKGYDTSPSVKKELISIP